MAVSLEHPPNALELDIVGGVVLRTVTVSRLVQFWNDAVPIEVTLAGMSMFFNGAK